MELVVLMVGAGLIAVVGIGIGMLVAPRLDRWAAPRPPADSPAADVPQPDSAEPPEDQRPDDHS